MKIATWYIKIYNLLFNEKKAPAHFLYQLTHLNQGAGASLLHFNRLEELDILWRDLALGLRLGICSLLCLKSLLDYVVGDRVNIELVEVLIFLASREVSAESIQLLRSQVVVQVVACVVVAVSR